MIDVVLLPEAEEDLSDTAAFLERRVPGLGDRLVAEVEYALGRLAENPYVGPHLVQDVRKLRVRRFPYNLIYRILPSHVLVLAVAHHRRRRKFWRGRR
ncbi:MAG TPA: type II toxin-antitoxin system RelE/ParE family toxin [Longimicrobiaceae bacterium]|nr:type II toxin-antitoxin system RelE/ParE family toxin [Longimicrobiaceae bacterium]